MGLIVFSVSSGNGNGGIGERARLLLRRRRMGLPPRQVDESGTRGGVVRQILEMVSGAAKNMKNTSTGCMAPLFDLFLRLWGDLEALTSFPQCLVITRIG